jgi:hypothetical protein
VCFDAPFDVSCVAHVERLIGAAEDVDVVDESLPEEAGGPDVKSLL